MDHEWVRVYRQVEDLKKKEHRNFAGNGRIDVQQ